MKRTFIGKHEKLETGKDYTLSIARGCGGATAFVDIGESETVNINYNSLSEIAKEWKSIVENPTNNSKNKKKKRRNK